MSVEDLLPMIIGGNPSDEEIAAITAAYAAYLAINGDKSVDNSSNDGISIELWAKSLIFAAYKGDGTILTGGSNSKWVSTHRIRARH
jgi:hypothetical protein